VRSGLKTDVDFGEVEIPVLGVCHSYNISGIAVRYAQSFFSDLSFFVYNISAYHESNTLYKQAPLPEVTAGAARQRQGSQIALRSQIIE